MANIKNANSHPIKATLVEDEGIYANSHPYKVTVEGGGGIATKADIEELNAKLEALATDLTYKGKVASEGDLPSSGNVEGDVYLTEDTGLLYVWADSEWIALNEASGLDPATTFWGQTARDGVVSGSIQLGTSSNTGSLAVTHHGDMYTSSSLRLGTSEAALTSFHGTADNNYASVWLERSSAYIASVSRLGTTRWALYPPTTTTAGYFHADNKQIKFLAAPTASTDAANKQYVDDLAISYATLNGAGAPTTATEGEYIGQLYLDAENGEMYYLAAIDDSVTPNTYTWAQMGGGGIPTDATFWGASYNATTNSVSGPVYSSMSSITRPTYPSAGFYTYSDSANPIVVGLGGTTSTTGLDRGCIQFYSQGNLGKRWCLLVGSDTVFSAGESAIDVRSKRILNVSDPTAAQDAATKNYVDTAVASAGAATLTNEQFNSIFNTNLEEA